jgi:subtilisin family serine protease
LSLALALLGTLCGGAHGLRAEGPDAAASLKMDTAVSGLAQLASPALQDEARESATATGLRLEHGRLQVRVSVQAGAAEEVSAGVAALGGEVTGRSDDADHLQAWLPLGALGALAARPDVTMIRRPALAHALEDDLLPAGLVSGGVLAAQADAWHAKGHRGQGVRLGIIDIGFRGYQSLLGGELPGQVVVRNFVDGQSDAQVDGTSSHGTACAEIVHDMAPEAALYLAKIATDIDLFEAVAWLRDVARVQIISTSLGWFNLSPGDGTGPLAQLASSVEAAGMLWVTAAGNMRQVHWGGPWLDTDGDLKLNFALGQNWNQLVVGGSALIPAGRAISIYLRWSDWTAVNQDYDLYLLRWTNYSIWEIIASSTDSQTGAPGQTPTEYVYSLTFGEPTGYVFAIQRIRGSAPVQFEAFAPGASSISPRTAARSLTNLADAAAVLTVGAVHVESPYPHQPYSSEGPTNGPGGVASGGNPKPDLAAYDGVMTASWGAFYGASAGTPHVAGAAAILRSAYPSWTMQQVRSMLEARAMDMGSLGRDNQYGYGRLHLGQPQARIWLPGIRR